MTKTCEIAARGSAGRPSISKQMEESNQHNDNASKSQFEDKGPTDEWKQHADLPHAPFQELFPGKLWQVKHCDMCFDKLVD